MYTTEELTEKLEGINKQLKRRYPIKRLAFFGEYAKGKPKKDAAIEMLVSLDRPIGIRFVDLEDDLEQRLGQRVNLVMKSSIDKKYLREIRQDIVYV